MYIEMKNVTKKIKNKTVLDDITVSLESGLIHGFVGANGSGKTMIFRAICGFIKLDSGTVTVNGEQVVFNTPLSTSIGLILETPGFVDNQTIVENLKYLANIKSKYNDEKVTELLKRFDILQYKDKKIGSLSLGTRQKVGIIQAIMEDQELLILDEPTNGLDKKSVQTFVEIMNELKQQGKTILLASHNEYEMRQLADTINEVSEGKIV